MLSVGNGKCTRNTMWPSLWSQTVPHARGVHATFMDSTILVLHTPITRIHIRRPDSSSIGPARRRGPVIGPRFVMANSTPLQLRVPISTPEVLAEPAEDWRNCLGITIGTPGARLD